jgi:hypothetical protein
MSASQAAVPAQCGLMKKVSARGELRQLTSTVQATILNDAG